MAPFFVHEMSLEVGWTPIVRSAQLPFCFRDRPAWSFHGR